MAKKKTGFRPEDSKKGDVVRFRYRGNECIMQCGGKSTQLAWPCAFAVGLWLTEEDRANGNPLNFYTDIDLPVSVAQNCTGLRRANLQEQRNLNAAINKWRDENTDTSKRGIPKGLTEAELDAMIAGQQNSGRTIVVRMSKKGNVHLTINENDLDADGYLTYDYVDEDLIGFAIRNNVLDDRVLYVGHNRPDGLVPFDGNLDGHPRYVAFEYRDHTGYINTCVARLDQEDGWYEYCVGYWGDSNYIGDPDHAWVGDYIENMDEIYNFRSASAADIDRYERVVGDYEDAVRNYDECMAAKEACKAIEDAFNGGFYPSFNFIERPEDISGVPTYFPCGYSEMMDYGKRHDWNLYLSKGLMAYKNYLSELFGEVVDASRVFGVMYMTACETKRLVLDAIHTGKRIRRIQVEPFSLENAVVLDSREARPDDKVEVHMSYSPNARICTTNGKKGTVADATGKWSALAAAKCEIPYRSLEAFCDNMLEVYVRSVLSCMLALFVKKCMPDYKEAERLLDTARKAYDGVVDKLSCIVDEPVDTIDNTSKAMLQKMRKFGVPTKPFIHDGEVYAFTQGDDDGILVATNFAGMLAYYCAFNIYGNGKLVKFDDTHTKVTRVLTDCNVTIVLPSGIQLRTPNIMERTYFDTLISPEEREKMVKEQHSHILDTHKRQLETQKQELLFNIEVRQKAVDAYKHNLDTVNEITKNTNDGLDFLYKTLSDPNYKHVFAVDPYHTEEEEEEPEDAPSEYIDTTAGYAESDYMQSDFHDRTAPDVYEDNDNEATVPDASASADTPAYSAAAAILPAVDGGDYKEETAKEAIVNIEATLPLLPYLRGQRLPQDFSFPIVSEQPLHNSKGRDISETKVVSGLLGAMNTIVHARETYDNIYYLTSDYHSEVVARCMQQRLVKAPSLLDLCPDGEAISGLIILPKDHNGGYNHFLYVVDRREAVWRIEVANFYNNRLINYYHGYRSNRLGVDSNCRYFTFADPAYDDVDPITNATKISNEMMAFVTTFVEMEQDADNIVRAAIEGSDDAVEVQAETVPEDVAKKYTATSDIILRDYAFYHYIFELKQIAVRGHLKHYLVGSRADGTLHRELRLVRAYTRKSRVKR